MMNKYQEKRMMAWVDKMFKAPDHSHRSSVRMGYRACFQDTKMLVKALELIESDRNLYRRAHLTARKALIEWKGKDWLKKDLKEEINE